MEKELTIKNSIKQLIPITNQIDSIINECMPIAQSQTQGFGEALVLAKGVFQLREIFFNNKDIQATIEAMKDTKLGFVSDRSKTAIEKSKKNGKALKPYTYNEIAECCIEALMKGYRLTDNEFNIIAGNFYAAKNGKFRKIIETEGLTDLRFANSSPIFKTEMRMVYKKPTQIQYAEIECYASWRMNGKLIYLGRNPKNKDDKDTLFFKIKTNEYMGDDGVVGKALSKLFTRILIRLSGKLIEESTDIDTPQIKVVNDESDAQTITNNIRQNIDIKTTKDKPTDKPKEKTSTTTFMQVVKSFEIRDISELELCAYFGVEDLIEMNTEEGMADLQKIASDIEGGKLTPEEFKKQAAERYEMRQKEA